MTGEQLYDERWQWAKQRGISLDEWGALRPEVKDIWQQRAARGPRGRRIEQLLREYDEASGELASATARRSALTEELAALGVDVAQREPVA